MKGSSRAGSGGGTVVDVDVWEGPGCCTKVCPNGSAKTSLLRTRTVPCDRKPRRVFGTYDDGIRWWWIGVVFWENKVDGFLVGVEGNERFRGGLGGLKDIVLSKNWCQQREKFVGGENYCTQPQRWWDPSLKYRVKIGWITGIWCASLVKQLFQGSCFIDTREKVSENNRNYQ